jgi:hypothetical protein
MIARVLPQPILTLVLAGVWLLLVNDVSAANVVLGLAIGLAVPLVTSRYWPDGGLPRRPTSSRPDYDRAFTQPAARASSSVQNQRSPCDSSILVFA